ncbi:MAG TPA: carbohydrate ABC transporter permease [Firmicutes bacterium]|nr:carbohydrate ABC transporter permease [Bacillota bacterium]
MTGVSRGTQGRLLTGLLFYAALIILLMITLFPIYWVVSTSFKSPLEVYAMPPRWSPGGLYLQNYIAALKGTPVARYLLNSLVVSLVATGAAVALGSLAAYAFSRYTFRGKDRLFFLILLLRMIPTIVTALPLYIIYSRLGISDTLKSGGARCVPSPP